MDRVVSGWIPPARRALEDSIKACFTFLTFLSYYDLWWFVIVLSGLVLFYSLHSGTSLLEMHLSTRLCGRRVAASAASPYIVWLSCPRIVSRLELHTKFMVGEKLGADVDAYSYHILEVHFRLFEVMLFWSCFQCRVGRRSGSHLKCFFEFEPFQIPVSMVYMNWLG